MSFRLILISCRFYGAYINVFEQDGSIISNYIIQTIDRECGADDLPARRCGRVIFSHHLVLKFR